jgi:hypothetical protein
MLGTWQTENRKIKCANTAVEQARNERSCWDEAKDKGEGKKQGKTKMGKEMDVVAAQSKEEEETHAAGISKGKVRSGNRRQNDGNGERIV